jgi:phenylpropionate dioxygenase-like ring-hydroxylating dioxygenase large terminal subunit
MTNDVLVEQLRDVVRHAGAGTTELTDDVMFVPASNYVDAGRHQLELDKIWRRVPLVLAWSAELPAPGSYLATTVLDVPVLLVRGDDGRVRGFVNTCSHRGAQVVDGCGSARRFTCPYHAWVYDRTGALVGVRDKAEFGDVDTTTLGLTELTVAERAGVVFGHVRPEAAIDIDVWLQGLDDALGHLELDGQYVLAKHTLEGPAWKVAYDGYLDFYHLPILHKDTFGPDFFNKAMFRAWGPHQRTMAPMPALAALAERPESTWGDRVTTSGVWTIFPHVAIATFDVAGTVVRQLAQLFPGPTPERSTTVFTYLTPQEPTGEQREAADKMVEFLLHVVGTEDYPTGVAITRGLRSGAKQHVLFGRNEGGLQRFHRWVEALVTTDDADVPRLLATGLG